MKKQPDKEGNVNIVLTENRHLKDTIAALREQLEALRYENEASVQKATAAAKAEIVELKASIVALREELERRTAGFEEGLQEERREHRDELNQLKRTIRELRDALTDKTQATVKG